MLRKHNLVVQSCQYDAEEVAKWSPTEVSKTITQCFQEQEAHDEGEELIGDTKLRGPADATSDAFDSGEAADNLPFVSLPDTEMEGGDDPLALAMIAAEKQTIMKELSASKPTRPSLDTICRTPLLPCFFVMMKH